MPKSKKSNKTKTPPKRVSKRGRENEGRPPKYTEIIENKKLMTLLYNLCLLGATYSEMAEALEINRDTFYEWMNNKAGNTKEFSDTIKKGRIEADARVGKSLFQRATGYKHKAVRHFKMEDGVIEAVEYIERFPPDPASMNIWLKNRRGTKQVDPQKHKEAVQWKDRHDLDVTTNGDPLPTTPGLPAIDYSQLSDATLRELANAVKK